jgi:hypothetical protein
MAEDALYRPELWSLDPDVLHLNHGSFGACPSQILEQQTQLRQQMEYNTLQFFERDLPELLETAREALGLFLGTTSQELVFVDNATSYPKIIPTPHGLFPAIQADPAQKTAACCIPFADATASVARGSGSGMHRMSRD